MSTMEIELNNMNSTGDANTVILEDENEPKGIAVLDQLLEQQLKEDSVDCFIKRVDTSEDNSEFALNYDETQVVTGSDFYNPKEVTLVANNSSLLEKEFAETLNGKEIPQNNDAEKFQESIDKITENENNETETCIRNINEVSEEVENEEEEKSQNENELSSLQSTDKTNNDIKYQSNKETIIGTIIENEGDTVKSVMENTAENVENTVESAVEGTAEITMEDIVQNMEDTVQNVEDTVQNVGDTVQNVGDTVQSVEDTVESVEDTVESVEDTVQNVEDTTDFVEAIGKCVEETTEYVMDDTEESVEAIAKCIMESAAKANVEVAPECILEDSGNNQVTSECVTEDVVEATMENVADASEDVVMVTTEVMEGTIVEKHISGDISNSTEVILASEIQSSDTEHLEKDVNNEEGNSEKTKEVRNLYLVFQPKEQTNKSGKDNESKKVVQCSELPTDGNCINVSTVNQDKPVAKVITIGNSNEPKNGKEMNTAIIVKKVTAKVIKNGSAVQAKPIKECVDDQTNSKGNVSNTMSNEMEKHHKSGITKEENSEKMATDDDVKNTEEEVNDVVQKSEEANDVNVQISTSPILPRKTYGNSKKTTRGLREVRVTHAQSKEQIKETDTPVDNLKDDRNQSGESTGKRSLNFRAVKRKFEEISRASRMEDAAAMEEVKKMRKETLDVLKKINKEMEKLKFVFMERK